MFFNNLCVLKATDLNDSWKSVDIYGDLTIMQGEFDHMINGLNKAIGESNDD